MFLRLIANKYHKGKVKKDFDKINKQCLNLLKRKRGVLLKLWKIAARAIALPVVSTQVWLRCSVRCAWRFFPCQSVSVHCSRVKAGTWYSVAWQMSVPAHT